MTITPQDIQAKQFHVRMRGFDMDEVDKFLEKIAEDLLIVSLENKQLLEKVESMEKELANYKNKEQAFQSAILSAQRISDEMQHKSRQEAEEMVATARENAAELASSSRLEVDELIEKSQQEAADLKANAEMEASRILADSQKEHEDLTNHINRLIEIKGRVMADMRQLLNNYLDHIDEAVPTGLNVLEPLPQPEQARQPADDIVPSQEAQPGFASQSAPFDEDIDDDLYEKLDLPEQIDPDYLDDLDEAATLDITDIEPMDSTDNDNILFSLEDPLDELEPSVSISEDDKTD